MRSVEPARQGRLNMRVSAHQERVLRAAADLNGETLTGAPPMLARTALGRHHQ